MFSEYKGCKCDETRLCRRSRSGNAESINHRANLISERIEHGTSAARLDVVLNLRATLVGCARRRDELNNLVGNQLHRFANLMLFRRPGQHPADLVEQILTHTTRFHYVRLLTEILSH